MVPLAIYRECRLERECVFELYPDAIRAAGRVARGKFETTIALSTLDPSFDRLWVFSQLFYSSALGFMVGLVALGLVVIGLNHGTFDSLAGFWSFITLSGFAMALFNGRKVELVSFRSVAGVPLLAIARTGKRSGKFDAFVSNLVEQIVSSKAKS
jgi:hypothetical protein